MAVHHHHHHHSGDDSGCISLIFGMMIVVGILVYAVGLETAVIGWGVLLAILVISQTRKS